MGPTHTMKHTLLYSKSIDLNMNSSRKIPLETSTITFGCHGLAKLARKINHHSSLVLLSFGGVGRASLSGLDHTEHECSSFCDSSPRPVLFPRMSHREARWPEAHRNAPLANTCLCVSSFFLAMGSPFIEPASSPGFYRLLLEPNFSWARSPD